MTKVIYEAPRPRYVVQELQTESTFEWGAEVFTSDWFDVKGFYSLPLAQDYADEQKRDDPSKGYRVVDTQDDSE